jgi:hypothetical protein
MIGFLTLLGRHDERALHAMVMRRRPSVDQFMRAVTHLGDVWLVVPLAAALPVAGGSAILGLALLIGLSRCYLGVHYPGDVLTGWTLALLAALSSAPLIG